MFKNKNFLTNLINCIPKIIKEFFYILLSIVAKGILSVFSIKLIFKVKHKMNVVENDRKIGFLESNILFQEAIEKNMNTKFFL